MANPLEMNRRFSRNQSGNAIWLSLGVLLIFVVLGVAGFIMKNANQKELNKMQETTVNALTKVYVVSAAPAEFKESGTLPGNIAAIQYASIFARVDGYLKTRLVDIGDTVRKGQLLAEIDTPTVDQQLAQAQEDLAEAKASYLGAMANLQETKAKELAAVANVEKSVADQEYTQVTATRWINMATRGAVSLQSRDEKVRANKAQISQVDAVKADKTAADQAVAASAAQVKTAQARVNAQVANVKRLEAQQAFKYVRAPFDGIITLRKVDAGDLITQGSQSSTTELFQMGQIDFLRIYVNVPQTVATYLKPGLKAVVSVPELPGRGFDGYVSNVSGALDPQTRTLQTEVRLKNQGHVLLPGMYAQVMLTVPRPDQWVRVPGSTLVPMKDSTYVAVIAPGNKAHYQEVMIGRDFGDYLEISHGLTGHETVIVSPPVDMAEGEVVDPIPLADASKVQDHAGSGSHKE